VTIASNKLRQFAEEPDATIVGDPPLPLRRIQTPRYTLIVTSPSSAQTMTSAVRTTGDELDATIEEVRATLRLLACVGNIWQIGPSCQPEGLAQRLVERGFRPVTRTPYEHRMSVMAMERRPAVPSAVTSVRTAMVSSLDDYVLALRVAMEAFSVSDEDAAGWMVAAAALWESQDGTTRFTHLAYLDDKPVGFGFSQACDAGVMLSGSGVLAAARGRGVYRALVGARWAAAERLRAPGLCVHAGAMSRPILERCGFEFVCELALYEDVSFSG
jgi:GNAT superfamily N-acetyltransferase